jgi:molybdopterin converting factor small subunit
MIKVELFAYLRDGIGKQLDVEYVSGIKVIDIVNQLKLNPERISIILINGKHQSLDTVIEDNQILKLFPPVGGG